MTTQVSKNPYEGVKIQDLQFGVSKTLTVKELKQIVPLDEQREKNQEKMRQKISGTGFSGKMVRPILISDTVGNDDIRDYKLTDGQHTADLICSLLDDNVDIPVVIYKHSPVDAARAFASWNKEGVQLLSSEQVFPAQVAYQDPDALRTLNVLARTGRKFSTVRATHNHNVGVLSQNKRVIRRGKLDEAININRTACELALNTQSKIWPVTGPEIEDSALLVFGWSYLFNSFPKLTESPQPYNLFVKWISNHPTKKTQNDWIYSGKRRAQKEKLDIAYFTLTDFLADMKGKHSTDQWYIDLVHDYQMFQYK